MTYQTRDAAIIHRTLTESTLRLVLLYRRRTLRIDSWPTAKVDPADVSRLYLANRERIATCRRIGIGVHHAIGAPAHVAAAGVYLLQEHGNNIRAVNRFMMGLSGGNLPFGDPRLSLRRIARAYAAQREPHPDHEMLAYLLRTWNLYAGNKTVSLVTWKPEDGMPRIGRMRP